MNFSFLEFLGRYQSMDQRARKHLWVQQDLLIQHSMLFLILAISYFSYFEGHSPVLVTSDLDIIQEVFIKQYSNFSGRKVTYLVCFLAPISKGLSVSSLNLIQKRGPIAARDSSPNQNLFSSSRSKWKRMRNIMNPTFSSSKLREVGSSGDQ